jgi:hypothetical protein
MDTETQPGDIERLRSLPSVERLAARLPEAPHQLAVAAARETIDPRGRRSAAAGRP